MTNIEKGWSPEPFLYSIQTTLLTRKKNLKMFGYLLFGLTLLFYIGLISINNSQPSMGGEGGMGYALALFSLGIGFTVSSLALTIVIAGKDGFAWVSDQGSTRTIVVGLGWLFMAVTTFACSAFRWEWHEGEFPQFLRWLAVGYGQIWIPLLMFVSYFMLLNSEIRSNVSILFIKIPLIIAFIVSTLSSAGVLYGWLKSSAQTQKAQLERIKSDDDKIHREHLNYIAEQKLTDPIVNILALTGRFHDEDVKKAAVEKIKSHPDWEAELIRLLDHEYYFSEVYTFIDGHPVEHPQLFLEPLNRSILRLADQIQKQISDANNLQEWHFENYGIERLLRAIDEQFSNKGMDFRPAVLILRKALGTPPPERFKGVKFTVTALVDRWLKSHGS